MERATDKRKETNWCVYRHTNEVNGKLYIGVTCQRPTRRWANGQGYVFCTRFYNAIKKYGWDAFRHDILFTDLTQEEAERLEVELIAKYDTTNPDKGYNLAAGGGGLAGYHHSSDAKAKMSAASAERWKDEAYRAKFSATNRGRKLSEEHKLSLSKAHKGKKLPPETCQRMSEAFKGRVFSDEHRQKLSEAALRSSPEHRRKISESHLGEKNPMYGKKSHLRKAVLCVETGVVYPSLQDAETATGASFKNISAVCRGVRNVAGGYHWRYADEAVTVDA